MELSGLLLNNKIVPAISNSWKDARNILIDKGFQSFSNEKGFDEQVTLPMPFIGKCFTGKETIVWLTNNAISEIGVVRNEEYIPIIRDSLFAFDTNYPIQGVFTYNFKGELIVAWTDNNTSPKILNLDNLPFKSGITADYNLIDPSEFTLTELFPNVSTPVIRPITVSDGGGNLLSGVYYVSAAYGYADGSLTNWLTISNPISIIEANTYRGFTQIEGCTAGIPTNKAIQVEINNIDDNFNYIYISVLTKINGIISAYKLTKYTIVGESLSVNINSVDRGTPLQIAEIISPSNSYVKVKTITTVGGELDLANLESLPDLDYQEFANKINVKWTREETISLDSSSGSYKDPITICSKRTFRAGEVYGLMAGLRLKKGGIYKLYHIPGRPPFTGDRDTLSQISYPEAFALDATGVKKYQVYDTSVDESSNGTKGKMGFWENRDEVYPSHFPDDVNDDALAGQPIRHHKFPSLSALETFGSKFIDSVGGIAPTVDTATLGPDTGVVFASPANYLKHLLPVPTSNNTFDANGNNYIATTPHYVIVDLALYMRAIVPTNSRTQVRVRKLDSANNQIGEALVDSWVSWIKVPEIDPNYPQSECEANHTISTFLNAGEKINIYISLPLTNYSSMVRTCDISFLQSDTYIAPSGTAFTKPLGLVISNIIIPDEIKEHIDGIEIFYYERDVTNMSILDQSLMINPDWNTDELDFTNSFRFHGFDTMNSRLPIKPTHISLQLQFAKATNINTSYLLGTTIMPYGEAIYQIASAVLLPAHNIATTPNNWAKENCVYIETVSDLPNLGVVSTLLINLHAYKRNMYPNMHAQRVISTGVFCRINNIQPDEELIVYGGDSFISAYGIIVYKDAVLPFSMNTDPILYSRRSYLFPCESSANIGFRNEGTNPNEKYYPKTLVTDDITFKDGLLYETGNWFEYNEDYTSVQNLYSPLQDDRSIPFTNLFPHRIARTLSQNSESSELRWRLLLATSYYDMPSDKGPIENIIGYGQSLFIRHRNSTYRAYVKDLLATLSTTTYLTKGDIFDREPEELIPIQEGYIGCQSRFSDIITKHGVVLVDRERGKIWLVGDGIKELTKEFVDEWFASNLNISTDEFVDYPILYDFERYIIAETGVSINYKNSALFGSALSNLDNPYKEKGIIVGFDDKNNRLLFTKHNTIIKEGIVEGQLQLPVVLKLGLKSNFNLGEGETGNIIFTLNVDDDNFDVKLEPVMEDPQLGEYLIVFDRVTQLVKIKEAIYAKLVEAGLELEYDVTVDNYCVTLVAVNMIAYNSITDIDIEHSGIVIVDSAPNRSIDQSDSFTLSYLIDKYWVCFHDYLPHAYFTSRTNVHCMYNLTNTSKIFNFFSATLRGEFPSAYTVAKIVHPSYMDIVLALKSQFANIIIDSIAWQADVRNPAINFNLWNKTLTHIMIYTENQCTGLIPVVFKNPMTRVGNTTFDQYWVLNDFRDQVLDILQAFMLEGELILDNMNGETPTTIVPGRTYITGGCDLSEDPDTHLPVNYVEYNGVNYQYSDSIITGIVDETSFVLHGTATLKNYKKWFDLSLIFSNFAIVRLLYDNIEANDISVNAVKINHSQKI